MMSARPTARTMRMPNVPALWKPKIWIAKANIAGPRKLTARPVVA